MSSTVLSGLTVAVSAVIAGSWKEVGTTEEDSVVVLDVVPGVFPAPQDPSRERGCCQVLVKPRETVRWQNRSRVPVTLTFPTEEHGPSVVIPPGEGHDRRFRDAGRYSFLIHDPRSRTTCGGTVVVTPFALSSAVVVIPVGRPVPTRSLLSGRAPVGNRTTVRSGAVVYWSNDGRAEVLLLFPVTGKEVRLPPGEYYGRRLTKPGPHEYVVVYPKEKASSWAGVILVKR